jgi:predicted small lipoprotein YifL
MSFVARTTVLLLFVTSLGGCGLHAVRPYERTKVNTPNMQATHETPRAAQRHHALALREAMRDGRDDDVAARR